MFSMKSNALFQYKPLDVKEISGVLTDGVSVVSAAYISEPVHLVCPTLRSTYLLPPCDVSKNNSKKVWSCKASCDEGVPLKWPVESRPLLSQVMLHAIAYSKWPRLDSYDTLNMLHQIPESSMKYMFVNRTVTELQLEIMWKKERHWCKL